MSQATSPLLRAAGFVHYHGRPRWLTDQVLAALVEESVQLRTTARQIERQAHSAAGPQARAFQRSPELLELIASSAEPVQPSGSANYLYYDQPQAGIDPHIDGPDFPLQILVMLAHSGYTDRRSTLVVFPQGPKNPVPVVLDPGEMTLFRAASVYHGRTTVSPGERLVLLGMGYAPATT